MPSLQDARSAAALRAVERGKAVLASVKAKGATAGQVMDADTERSLWPQVFGEAFARELHSIVAAPASVDASAKSGAADGAASAGTKAASASAGPALGKGSAPVGGAPPSSAASAPAPPSSADDVASPFHVLAASNYLREATLASLFAKRAAAAAAGAGAAAAGAAKSTAAADNACGPIPGVALQAGPFLDEDADAWRRLALDDCARMAEEPQRWSPALTAESVAAATIVLAGQGDGAASPSALPTNGGPAAAAASTSTTAAAAAARLSLRGVSSSSYAWLNDAEAEGEFPALSEVLQRLHALPYELNRKVPGRGLLLHKPRPGTALLRRISVTLTWKLAPSAASPPSASGKGAGAASKVILLGGAGRSAAEGGHGGDGDGEADDDEDEAVLEMPLLPHGPSFVPHAPGAAAAGTAAATGGAGAAAAGGDSGPVLLTVVYAAGRVTTATALPSEPSPALSAAGDGGAGGDGSGHSEGASAGSSASAVSVKASARLVSEFDAAGAVAASKAGASAGAGADTSPSVPPAAVDLTAGNQLLLHRTRDVPTRPCLRCKVTVRVPRRKHAAAAAAATPGEGASPPPPFPASPLSGSVRVDVFTVCAYVRGPADSPLLPPAP